MTIKLNEDKTEMTTVRLRPSVLKKIKKDKVNISKLIEMNMFGTGANKYEKALRESLKKKRDKRKKELVDREKSK